MDKAIIYILQNNIINNNIKTIKQNEFGFIDFDNHIDINTINNMCLHCLQNIDIFTEEQLNKIKHIINKIHYGRNL